MGWLRSSALGSEPVNRTTSRHRWAKPGLSAGTSHTTRTSGEAPSITASATPSRPDTRLRRKTLLPGRTVSNGRTFARGSIGTRRRTPVGVASEDRTGGSADPRGAAVEPSSCTRGSIGRPPYPEIAAPDTAAAAVHGAPTEGPAGASLQDGVGHRRPGEPPAWTAAAGRRSRRDRVRVVPRGRAALRSHQRARVRSRHSRSSWASCSRFARSRTPGAACTPAAGVTPASPTSRELSLR